MNLKSFMSFVLSLRGPAPLQNLLGKEDVEVGVANVDMRYFLVCSS